MSSSTEPNLAVARTEALYRRSEIWPAATFITAGFFAYVAKGSIAAEVLLPWLLSITVISLSQLILSWFYDRLSLSEDNYKIWRNSAVVGWLMIGVCWGVAAIMLFPDQSTSLQALLILLIIGLAFGLIRPLSPVLPAALCFLVTSTGPLIYNLTIQPESGLQENIGHLLAFILLVMLLTAIRTAR